MTRGPGRRFRRNKCDDLLLVRLPQHGLVCCETECDLDSLPPVAACACYRHVPRTSGRAPHRTAATRCQFLVAFDGAPRASAIWTD